MTLQFICRLNEQQQQPQCRGGNLRHNLVIDGRSLSFALEDHSELLRSVCEKCTAVLCCRLSPIQKAQVFIMSDLAPRRHLVHCLMSFDVYCQLWNRWDYREHCDETNITDMLNIQICL